MNVDARAVFSEMVAQAMQPVPEDPHLSTEVIEERKASRARREGVIRSNPAAFVPLVRKALSLPKPEDLQVPTTREGWVEDAPEQYRELTAGASVAAQILSLLPADIRDPILRESFDRAAVVARIVDSRGMSEIKEWMDAGRPEDRKVAVTITKRKIQWFAGACARLINSAATARSEVLIEPVFTHLASKDGGLAQTSVAYLERFPARYEEFIRRLNEILDSGRPLDFDRKYNIEQSIKRMQASRL